MEFIGLSAALIAAIMPGRGGWAIGHDLEYEAGLGLAQLTLAAVCVIEPPALAHGLVLLAALTAATAAAQRHPSPAVPARPDQ